MTHRIVRAVLGAVGAVLVVTGLAMIPGAADFGGGGFTMVLLGGFLIVVALLERNRYRSESADRANEPVGPGGGETGGPVEPRFRPTNELFLDPTTKVRMRVLVDPLTGERRYIAEADG